MKEHEERKLKKELKREERRQAWEATKLKMKQNISEAWNAVVKAGKADWAETKADYSSAKDGLRNWTNEKRMKLAGTAELKGEVEALREQVARQGRLIEQLLRLQGVSVEEPTSEADDEEGEGKVTETRI